MIVFTIENDLCIGWVEVGFTIPIGVFNIMSGKSLVESLCLFGIYFLDELGRHATPQFSIADVCIRKHESTSSDDCALANDGVVEHSGTHADEGTVQNRATMKGNTVSDSDILSNIYRRCAIEGVHTGIVLDVAAIAYLDIMNIASKDGAWPNGDIVAQSYFADDNGTVCQIAMPSEFGFKVFDGFNDCHRRECFDNR